jgi:hypothetical protein
MKPLEEFTMRTRDDERTRRPAFFLAAGLAMAAALLPWTTPTAGAAPPDRTSQVVPFERDVFVIVGSTLRHPDATTDPAAPLFNVAGVALGLTWGGFSAADADTTVQTVHGGTESQVRLQFSGLVPGGVYSIFWGTLEPDSENPLCPGVERTLALTSVNGKQQPDDSSFMAGTDGRAAFHGRANANLLVAGQAFFSLVYHFDGRTYGPVPNRGEFLTQGPTCRSSFGEEAFRQIVILQTP